MKKIIKNYLRKNQSLKGFTLIEMVIVIAIVVMLLVIIAPNLVHQRQVAQNKTDQAFATTLQTQVELYNDENPKKKLVNDLAPLASGNKYLSEKQKEKLKLYRLDKGKVVLKDEKD